VPAPLKVLFVASECAPFAKTGGLADVAGALPKDLRALGIDPAFIRRLGEAGYRTLSISELQRLAAFGVNDAFLRDLARYRTRGDIQ